MPSNRRKEDNFEIKFYEGILKDNPDFVECLAALGDLYTKKGFYEKGLKVDLRLAKLKPEDPVVLYNLACSYSLVKDLDKAFVMIKKAVKYGYNDFRHMKKDHDLDNLRSDKRFQRYYTKIIGKN